MILPVDDRSNDGVEDQLDARLRSKQPPHPTVLLLVIEVLNLGLRRGEGGGLRGGFGGVPQVVVLLREVRQIG